ncbi:alpha/beta fold hydrolase [Streptomyces sp. NPDC051322]|uniref:alpha/beta hydrolase n=1 Tax=Streptomyces sp. NPDC051322 TaxID=3154645 RepID=UPI00344FB649
MTPQSVIKQQVMFPVEGTTVRGTLRLPPGPGPHPAVVLGHGWSMVAGGNLEDFALAFVSRSTATLSIDFRHLGLSDGLPRQDLDPWRQIEDYRMAITYLGGLEEIDSDRIGVWGTSFSGGHVLVVAATDPRVRAVVSQVPTINGYQASLRRNSPATLKRQAAAFQADREAQLRGETPAVIATVTSDPSAPASYPDAESLSYMSGEGERTGTWLNYTTLRSAERARAYAPGEFVPRIESAQLLMVVADRDVVTPTDLQVAAYESARTVKRLVVVPGGHYAPYHEQFETASTAAADWFEQILTPRS